MNIIERQVLVEAKTVFRNPKLHHVDILEWSASEKIVTKSMEDGEVTAKIPSGYWVCIVVENDRRTLREKGVG